MSLNTLSLYLFLINCFCCGLSLGFGIIYIQKIRWPSFFGFFLGLGFFIKSSWFIIYLLLFNYYSYFLFFGFFLLFGILWHSGSVKSNFFNQYCVGGKNTFLFFCFLIFSLVFFNLVYIIPLTFVYFILKFFFSVFPALIFVFIFTFSSWKNILTYFFEPMPYSAPRGALFLTRVLGLFPAWVFKYPFLIGPIYLFLYFNVINICVLWMISSTYTFWVIFISICLFTLFRTFRVWFLQKPDIIKRLIYNKCFFEFADFSVVLPPSPRNLLKPIWLVFDSLFNFLLWLDYSEDYLVEIFYFIFKIFLFVYNYIASRFYSFVFLFSVLTCIHNYFSIWYLFFCFLFCMVCLSYVSGFKSYLSEAFLSSFEESSIHTPEVGTSLNSFLSGTAQTVLIYNLNFFFIVFAYCFFSNNLLKLNCFLKSFLKNFHLINFKKYLPKINRTDVSGLSFIFKIYASWFGSIFLCLNKYSLVFAVFFITFCNFFSCFFFYRFYLYFVDLFILFEWNSSLAFILFFAFISSSVVFWSQFLYNYLQHEVNFLRLLPGNNWNIHQSQIIDICWFFYFPCFLFLSFIYSLFIVFYKFFWVFFSCVVFYSFFYNWYFLYIIFIFMVLFYKSEVIPLNYFFFFIILTFFCKMEFCLFFFLVFLFYFFIEPVFLWSFKTNFRFGLVLLVVLIGLILFFIWVGAGFSF